MKCHPLISHRPIPKVTCMKNRPLRNSACRNGFGPAWLIEWLLSTRWCKLWCQHLWPPNRRICASCFWITIPTTKIGIQLAMIKKKNGFPANVCKSRSWRCHANKDWYLCCCLSSDSVLDPAKFPLSSMMPATAMTSTPDPHHLAIFRSWRVIPSGNQTWLEMPNSWIV